MIRRLAGVVLAVCALLALAAADAGAEVLSGPRLTFMRARDSQFQLVSSDPAGQDQQVIVAGSNKSELLPLPFSPPAWSADGTRVAFTGLTRSEGESLLDIYDTAADGSNIAKLPRTKDGIFPVLSPDGHTLAFARERKRERRRPHRGEVTVFRSVSIWLLNIDSGALRQLTPWRNGLSQFPSSFSPDGSTLAITRDQRKGRHRTRVSAVALRLDGSGSKVLARNAGEAVYSPDGTRLALITVGKPKTRESQEGTETVTPTELAVANAGGSGLIRLTHTRALELQPSWDPSSRRLAYTQFQAGGGEADILGFGDSIMEINADGSCRTRVLSYPGTILYGATWQPGPGREAGPIAC
ncbi:MAG: TolB family protein [Solirubrobacterales bacterium]